MADQGTPIDIIRQLLGHESLHATKMYINPHYVRNKDIIMPENQIAINYLKDKLWMKFGNISFVQANSRDLSHFGDTTT